ncbi:pseudouridine synthase [Mycoplasma sp. 5370]
MRIIKATLNDEGRRLYKFIIKYFNKVPLSKIEKLFRLKDIKINGKRSNDKKYIIRVNDEIQVYGLNEEKINQEFTTTNNSKEKNFSIIFEDKNILIVNKEENIAIHSEDNCLDLQILKYLNFKQKDSFIPSHIGRIDKKTSGIVIYAKNYKALVELKEKQKKFEKIYIFKSDIKIDNKFTSSLFLEKDETKQKMKVVKNSNILAITEFFSENSKKYARLITGKKHQIRVTLSHLGFPIYGDTKYGGKKNFRVFLHSHRIKFKDLSGDLSYLNDKEFISYPKW